MVLTSRGSNDDTVLCATHSSCNHDADYSHLKEDHENDSQRNPTITAHLIITIPDVVVVEILVVKINRLDGELLFVEVHFGELVIEVAWITCF